MRQHTSYLFFIFQGENDIIYLGEKSMLEILEEKKYNKMPVWKCVAFGIWCIQQEFEIYKVLAHGKAYDMTKFLNKTVERFWQTAATGYLMDEQYILAVEESFFEPESLWDKMALTVVQDLYALFYSVYNKKGREILSFGRKRLELIEKYVEAASKESASSEKIDKAQLVNELVAATEKIIMEIEAVPNKEKKQYLAELKEREVIFILGNNFPSYVPVKAAEKPAKKKIPEIRRTSLIADKLIKEHKANSSFEWMLSAKPYQWVPGYNPQNPSDGAYKSEYEAKNYLELSHNMEVQYHLLAREDYLTNGSPDRVRAFWYMSALTTIYAYKLEEKGFPLNPKAPVYHYIARHKEGMSGFCTTPSDFYYAYAAGCDELLDDIFYFAPKSRAEECRLLYKVFTHKADSNDADKLNIIGYDVMADILRGNAKEARKGILKGIRHIRNSYDMLGEIVDIHGCAHLRLAKEYNLAIPAIDAYEVFYNDLNFKKIDKNKWKLPYQDEMDQWLRK